MKFTTTTEVDVSVELLAKLFSELNDDLQCKFLVEVARLSKEWKDADGQWYYLGGHLRNCECSTEETREMLRSWVYFMESSTHGIKEEVSV